jgi:hypothetical protein
MKGIAIGLYVGITFLLIVVNTNVHTLRQSEASASAQDSVTVLLDGKKIPAEGFIHIYDSTPSIILSGHVAAHLPCDKTGSSLVRVAGGVAPKGSPFNMTRLDELSILGSQCMYHVDLPPNNQTVTDIALINPSTKNITLPDTTSVVIHISQFGGNDATNNPNLAYNIFNTTSKKIITHIHPLLNVTVDGMPLVVPGGIGINSSFWNDHSFDQYGMGPMKMSMGSTSMIMQGMAPLHTHDTSGTIHVESNEIRNYTLGQFLDNWGIDLDGKIVKLSVDGKPIKDYRNHILRDNEHMILNIETQKN